MFYHQFTYQDYLVLHKANGTLHPRLLSGKMHGLLSSGSLSCTLSSWAAENCHAQPPGLVFQRKDAKQSEL